MELRRESCQFSYFLFFLHFWHFLSFDPQGCFSFRDRTTGLDVKGICFAFLGVSVTYADDNDLS